MKKDHIIIALVGIIGIMAGILIGRGGSTPSTTAPAVVAPQVAADDGKLAKEYKKNEIMKVIRENAKSIQECYLTFLDKKPKIEEGVIRFIISLKEDGAVGSTKVTRNEFEDDDFGSCVSGKLDGLYFAPPPLGINRNISHELAFKSEETAKREAEEARQRNALPKVLPVSPEQMNQK